MARLRELPSQSDFGGFLDIICDFAFYIAVPIGFGFAVSTNLPFALILVGSFTLTGISFLAYAAIASKKGAETEAHGKKSFFYHTGLAEGTETIIAFHSHVPASAIFQCHCFGLYGHVRRHSVAKNPCSAL